MFIAMLLAASLCNPPPLPEQKLRTPAFWYDYLTQVLQTCYGHLAPAVTESTAAASPLVHIASTFCWEQERLTCSVLVEPAFLQWAPSPAHVVVVVGHEAARIASHQNPALQGVTREQEEATADMVAVHSVPQGACLLVEVYEWHLARVADAAATGLPPRITLLRHLCIAQRTTQ